MAEITLRVDNLVTFSDAARTLGVARASVYNHIARQRLHTIAIGNNRYLLREEVETLKRVLSRQRKEALEKRNENHGNSNENHGKSNGNE